MSPPLDVASAVPAAPVVIPTTAAMVASTRSPRDDISNQTILTAAIEADPRSVERLRGLITVFRDEQENSTPGGEKYARLRASVPTLHFMSMMIFEDPHYDPVLTIEVNFDGEAGPFWAELESSIGSSLRAMLRCCEVPRGSTAPMFQAIVAEDSKLPLAPFFEAHTYLPLTGHVGARGLSCARILREQALFGAIQDRLGNGAAYGNQTPAQVHAGLRQDLLPAFPWIDEEPPPVIGASENLVDWAKFFTFVVIALAALSAPALAFLTIFPPWHVVIGSALVAIAAILCIDGLRDALRKSPADVATVPARTATSGGSGMLKWIVLGVMAAVIVVVAVVLVGCAIRESVYPTWGTFLVACGKALAVMLCGVVMSVAIVLAWVRRLEGRDTIHDDPKVAPENRDAMALLEDRVTQNHMGSLLIVKPGMLRAFLIRAAFMALGLAVRIMARDGYLGSMRTIHFAHWTLLDNGSRLVFFSNFDGSWESYLDDFTEKASAGTTLAWTNCIGFPSVRFLILDGAKQGRLFKAYARHSMAPSLFWYSAYPELTVNRVIRQQGVADGLRQKTLGEKEAAEWVSKL